MQVVDLHIKTSITQTQLHKSSNYSSSLCSSMNLLPVEETEEISDINKFEPKQSTDFHEKYSINYC